MSSPSISKCSRRNWVSSVTWRKTDQEAPDHFQHFCLQSQFSPAHHCELMKACMVCDVARHKSLKALKVRQYSHRAFNLFDLLLLLLQRGAVQVQQCGGDANRKVVGVHLVLVSALQDVMKDADQMFQKGFIRPRKLVRYPGSKNGEGLLQKKENRQKTKDWRLFLFCFVSL